MHDHAAADVDAHVPVDAACGGPRPRGHGHDHAGLQVSLVGARAEVPVHVVGVAAGVAVACGAVDLRDPHGAQAGAGRPHAIAGVHDGLALGAGVARAHGSADARAAAVGGRGCGRLARGLGGCCLALLLLGRGEDLRVALLHEGADVVGEVRHDRRGLVLLGLHGGELLALLLLELFEVRLLALELGLRRVEGVRGLARRLGGDGAQGTRDEAGRDGRDAEHGLERGAARHEAAALYGCAPGGALGGS